MQNRTLTFLFSTSLIFVGLLLLSNYLFPPKPAQDEANPPEVAKQETAATDRSTENPTAIPPSAEATANSPPRYFTLGSLDENADSRYLVTLCDQGGALTRIELNSRDKSGRQRYRDLSHFGGYVGKLQLALRDGFVVAGVVGPGTPAGQAGLKAGDRIRSFNGEPVTSPADFDRLLANIRSDQPIALEIERGDSTQPEKLELTVQSSEQPLELLRPEIDLLGPGTQSPPSLITSLRKPPGAEDVTGGDWPELDKRIRTAPWQVNETTIEGSPAIEFSYLIEPSAAPELKLPGSIQIIKRYWLPKLDETNRNDHASRSYHLNFQLVVKNLADQKQSIGMELDGPTGATTEGWWYQNKINGDSSKFGYTAGSRDVVGHTEAKGFFFFGCPEIVANIQKAAPRFLWIANPNYTLTDKSHAAIAYLGVDTQYFNISLLPIDSKDNTQQDYACYSALASTATSSLPKQASLKRLVDCTFYLFERYELEPGEEYRQRYELFAGPKEVDLLQTYGLSDVRSFGWFAWPSQFLCWLLTVLYRLTFSWSYGIAIVLLTVIVRVLIIPLSRKAALNAQMMQLLAPEMKAIADKYKDDMEKRAQAQRELFRKHKYNPFGGCVLIFLQLPIFIGLYRGLSVDIVLRDQPLIPGMRWCSNLAAPDSAWYWADWMPSFLGSETGWFGPWLNILPIITIALFLVQQKMFTPPATDEQQAMAQKMMKYMMIFMGVMFFKVPAGLCIYFITSSIWGIAERQLLPKPKLSEDKVKSIKSGSENEEPKPNGNKSSNVGGFVNRIRDAIERRAKPEPTLNPEEQRRLDRERRKKLKDRGQ